MTALLAGLRPKRFFCEVFFAPELPHRPGERKFPNLFCLNHARINLKLLLCSPSLYSSCCAKYILLLFFSELYRGAIFYTAICANFCVTFAHLPAPCAKNVRKLVQTKSTARRKGRRCFFYGLHPLWFNSAQGERRWFFCGCRTDKKTWDR
jgi:hypothetical protein